MTGEVGREAGLEDRGRLDGGGARLVTLGWLGLAVGALGTLTVLAAYRRWIQPWQHRWGATDEEVRRPMPGDELLPGAASTTRAITIAARPSRSGHG